MGLAIRSSRCKRLLRTSRGYRLGLSQTPFLASTVWRGSCLDQDPGRKHVGVPVRLGITKAALWGELKRACPVHVALKSLSWHPLISCFETCAEGAMRPRHNSFTSRLPAGRVSHPALQQRLSRLCLALRTSCYVMAAQPARGIFRCCPPKNTMEGSDRYRRFHRQRCSQGKNQ